MSAEEDWGALESDVLPDGTFNPATRTGHTADTKDVKFPCTACGGTGKYRGVRRHQPESRCFACNGKGYFLTSERARQRARQSAATTKARKLSEALAAFYEQNPGIADFLAAASSWSSFAMELTGKLNQYGSLTDGQLRAARSMQAKTVARRAERQTERIAGNLSVDLAPIRAMFETAVGNGYKRPVYRAAGLVISRAPNHGRNAGALYVNRAETNDYLGKIIG